MSILSTNTKLIKVGQDYSAGSGISIDDHTISVTGEFGKTYSAGDNISIYNQGEQLYISSKDWANDIANASANAYNKAIAQIPAPFNPDYISAQVDNKLDATAFTAWQNGQYSTDLQTIEGQISNKQDSLTFGHGTASGSISSINGSAIIDDYTYHMLNVTRVSTANLHRTINSNSGTWNSVTNKLDTTSFSTVSGTFLTDDNTVMLEYGTSTWAEFKSAYDAHKNIVMYNQDTGEISNQYATFGYAIFDDTPYEAAFTTVCFGTEYRFTLNSNNVWKSYSQMYQYRGNYYSASNPSGFITGVNIPESAVWQDVSTTVQTNSAQWGEGGGVTGNYIPYTAVDSVFPAFETNSGLEIKTNTVAGTLYNTYINDRYISLSYINSNLDINDRLVLKTGSLAFKTNSDSAYVDKEKIHTWDSASNYIQSNSSSLTEVSTTVQSNSAQWAGGVTGEFVPQSAFDELKQSYNALSSLFATYSGQWLLPNEGV